MPDLTSQDVAEIKSFLSRTCEDVLIWLPGTGWQPAWQSEAANELGNSEVGANSNLLTRSTVPMRPPPADRGNRRDSVLTAAGPGRCVPASGPVPQRTAAHTWPANDRRVALLAMSIDICRDSPMAGHRSRSGRSTASSAEMACALLR